MPIEPDLWMLAAEEIAALRANLFRETPLQMLERIGLGLALAHQGAQSGRRARRAAGFWAGF